MSTTATTSTSPFPWLQSMQYVSLLACLIIHKHRLKIHNTLSFMYLPVVIKRHKTRFSSTYSAVCFSLVLEVDASKILDFTFGLCLHN